MDRISGYKDRALDSLKDKWADSVMATLLTGAIIYIPIYVVFLTMAFQENYEMGYCSYVWFIPTLPLLWGFSVFFLNVARNIPTKMVDLFDGYNDIGRILGTMLLRYVYISLWTLLLIVPGIVKYYSYAMTEYILKDDPDIKYNAAIKKSAELMKGHKLDLFLLHLSFIGWAILSGCTMYIGFLFLYPYVNTAFAHFYEDLKEEQQYS